MIKNLSQGFDNYFDTCEVSRAAIGVEGEMCPKKRIRQM